MIFKGMEIPIYSMIIISAVEGQYCSRGNISNKNCTAAGKEMNAKAE
jgi:hypothetical protein